MREINSKPPADGGYYGGEYILDADDIADLDDDAIALLRERLGLAQGENDNLTTRDSVIKMLEAMPPAERRALSINALKDLWFHKKTGVSPKYVWQIISQHRNDPTKG